jgi:hypothetical protein
VIFELRNAFKIASHPMLRFAEAVLMIAAFVLLREALVS